MVAPLLVLHCGVAGVVLFACSLTHIYDRFAYSSGQGKVSWLYDLLGLGAVMAGLILWHIRPETKKK